MTVARGAPKKWGLPMLAVEISTESYSNRGGVAGLDRWDTVVLTSVDKQAHHSYFCYPKDALETFLEERSALSTKFDAPATLRELVLDFDGGEGMLDEVLLEVRLFVRHIMQQFDIPASCIRVWYSGKKGFHVCIDGRIFGIPPSRDLPYQVKDMIKRHFNHPMIDLAPVNPAGLIRTPWSLHTGTGMNKTIIPLSELFTKKDLELGSSDRFSDEEKLAFANWPSDEEWEEEGVGPLLNPLVNTTIRDSRRRFSEQNRNLARHDPTAMVTCMQKLLTRGPVSGRRHQDVLRLASWLWRSGIPAAHAVDVLHAWLPQSELKHVVEYVYDKGYAYGCQDEVLVEFCDTRCVFHPKKNFAMDIHGSEEIDQALAEYIKMLDSGRGFDLVDLYTNGDGTYRVVPGEMILLVADTGMGKTLWAQDLIFKVGKRTLWCENEMPQELMGRRFYQSALGVSKQEVISDIRRGNTHKYKVKMDHVRSIFEVVTMEQIERAVQQFRPEILVIDTTDGINVPEAGNNELWQMKAIIQGLRQIADRYKVIVLAIHHINKTGARALTGESDMKGRKRGLTLSDPGGKRDAVTKVDHVLGLEGDRNEPTRFLTSLKARDEKPLSIPLAFDFEHQQVNPIQQHPLGGAMIL